MDEDRPWVVLFPYLPITSRLQLGARWQIVPLSEFEGPWAVDWFENVVKQIAQKHLTPHGTPVRRPALLVDATRGVTGQLPNDDDLIAIEAALGFGVVDAGGFLRSRAELEKIAEYDAPMYQRPAGDLLEDLIERNEDRMEMGWNAATSDNVEPYIWPLNEDARIAMEYGSIVRRTVGGTAKIVAPSELNIPISLSLDGERVHALYQVLTRARADNIARQLREAVRWMLQAWRNTPSLRPEHRVVMLRTAFEVLLAHGEHTNKETLARRLSERFAGVVADELVRPGQLLYQPGLERNVLHLNRANPRLAPFDDLERWFIGLSLARNEIVHDGDIPELADSTEGSVFSGEYWSVATRVLRDLVLVELHTRGYRHLWTDSVARAGRPAFAYLMRDHQTAMTEVDLPLPEELGG